MAGKKGVTVQKTLVWKNLVGQQRVKDTLKAAFENNTLGHAYLFCGSLGVGKFQTALEMAFALLCTSKEEVPCYNCDSCKQIQNYSHPDFHCVFPVLLDKSHKSSSESSKLSEDGWVFVADETQKRIKNPYTMSESRLQNIPVEWIRELNQSIMRGTTQGSCNIAIICNIDILSAASANAMLKTLEEPPENTLIFLITERPHAVLPTIRSRCQIIRFGNISPDEIALALANDLSLEKNDPKILQIIESASGSYGKAKDLVDESLDLYASQAKILWELVVSNAPWNIMAQRIESIVSDHLGAGRDYAACEKFLLSFLYIIRTTFFDNIRGTEKYIYGDSQLETSSRNQSVGKTEALFECCEEAISNVRARGNILLVLVTFLMTFLEIIHGKKQ